MATSRVSYYLSNVFNEAGLPDVTYVPPKEARQLVGSLATPGKHVTLVGPSGSGKSTLAHRSLNKLGLDDAKVHSFSGRDYSSTNSFLEILSQEFDVDPEWETVEDWLSAYDMIFIDDVHHLVLPARQELASKLKRWHERGIRFFMVGIAKTSDEILGADPELSIRNDVHRLGGQGPDFMREIVRLGEDALNINFGEKDIETVIQAARGIPSILQAILRIACIEQEINSTSEITVSVPIVLSEIREAVVRQYDGRYLRKVVGLARGRRQARSVHDTYFRIVEYVASNDKDQTSKDELYHKVVGSKDARQKSRIRNSFYRAMNNLPIVIQENDLNDVLLYENDTLSVDDPVFRFYLTNVDFQRVRSQVNIRRVGYEYDVAVSFAGEDRPQVEQLVEAMKKLGLEVFYDFDQQATLWGRDLRKELAKVYANDAQFMLLCLSEHYPEKDWTTFEFEVAKNAVNKRADDYLLPLIIGNRKPTVVGLPQTIGHLDMNHMTSDQVAALIAQKVALVDNDIPEEK